MDWLEQFSSPEAIPGALALWREAQGEALTHLNMRIKLKEEAESPWFFDVRDEVVGEHWLLYARGDDQLYAEVPLAQLEWVRIRPYYRAACIGFKNSIFKVGGEHP